MLNNFKLRNLAAISLLLFSSALTCVGQDGPSKPTIAVIYADWCPYCQALKPTLAAINEKYHSKVNFARLDVTNEATTARTLTIAKKKGLSEFFVENKDMTSLVAVFDSKGKEVFRTTHNYNRKDYEDALDRALTAAAKKNSGQKASEH